MRAFRLAVAAALITLIPAHAADRTTQTFEQEGFAAAFTGEVEAHRMKPTARLVRATTYTQMNADGTAGYVVATTRIADGEPINVSAIARQTMKSYECGEIVQDARIDVDGMTAREMHATGCFKGTSVGARFFKRDQWLYQVLYLVMDERDRADGERFLASFRLVPLKE
jgi:hypothetical protein